MKVFKFIFGILLDFKNRYFLLILSKDFGNNWFSWFVHFLLAFCSFVEMINYLRRIQVFSTCHRIDISTIRIFSKTVKDILLDTFYRTLKRILLNIQVHNILFALKQIYFTFFFVIMFKRKLSPFRTLFQLKTFIFIKRLHLLRLIYFHILIHNYLFPISYRNSKVIHLFNFWFNCRNDN